MYVCMSTRLEGIRKCDNVHGGQHVAVAILVVHGIFSTRMGQSVHDMVHSHADGPVNN
jgi:hypothetical protein